MARQIRTRYATAATLVVALAPATFAATASAAATPATVTVDRACYVATKSGTPLTVTGSGFAPNESVSLTDKTGQVDTMTTANAAGQISVTTKSPAPILENPGQKKDTITAEQFTDSGTYKGTVTFLITEVALKAGTTHREPGLRALTERVPFSFSGFPVGKRIWAHYTYGGKLVASQSFGKPKGPCGLLKVRRRLFPRTPHHRAYKVQIDLKKKYSKKSKPALHTEVKLTSF